MFSNMNLNKYVHRLLVESLDCHEIKITDEISKEDSRFNSAEDLLRSGGISIEALDRAAHGFTVDDVKTLLPKQLNIKWKEDLANVVYEVERGAERNGMSFDKYKILWSKKVDLSEPIEVSFEKGKFYIEDGHHRYFAAKTLSLPLNVDLTIKMNPIKVLSNLSYDDFHRCVFDQVAKNRLNNL